MKQILNLDHKLYTLQKYLVCKSQVENDDTFTEISLSLADFLNINVIFYFHFLQGMLSHPLCYLKRALFKARKSGIFKTFFFAANAKSNALDLTEFQNQVLYRKFVRE